MATKLNDAPTLVPCDACGALNWGSEGKAPAACEGCGQRPGTARRSKPCPGCGRPKRIGQACCEAPQRRTTTSYQASRGTLAEHARQELMIPLVLLLVGGLTGVACGASALGLGTSIVVHALGIGLYVLTGLLAGYLIGGSLLGWELGGLGETALKLAALAAFDYGATGLVEAIGIGLLGSITIWIAGWLLMMRFFKLSFVQCFFFRVTMVVSSIFVAMGAASAVVAVLG